MLVNRWKRIKNNTCQRIRVQNHYHLLIFQWMVLSCFCEHVCICCCVYFIFYFHSFPLCPITHIHSITESSIGITPVHHAFLSRKRFNKSSVINRIGLCLLKVYFYCHYFDLILWFIKNIWIGKTSILFHLRLSLNSACLWMVYIWGAFPSFSKESQLHFHWCISKLVVTADMELIFHLIIHCLSKFADFVLEFF